ncbi:MAG TPA: hypothetical protein VF457_18380 [Burkholderiaceae bacterium]
MATLHLELEIDSDVHPELYARLASIERSAARQEKLRQLAATGLIWEIARLHGPAFSVPEALELAEAAPRPVELGGDPAPAVDAGSVIDHAPVVPQDVPVLVDVVDEAEMDGAGIEDPPPGALVLRAREGAEASGSAAFASASPAPVEVPHGRTRSARMRRMKESGLFQNG